ncbi:MAG TPA: alkaline phosphatase family protein [Gemmatimonadota bacterium]|nr:alkaline phosphatase family protein [Gemmatimonadota bacterium]
MSVVGDSRRKALVVGLDVGDGDLILKWARRGHLPVLGSLIERGTWARLATTAELLHVSGWPSIYTGSLPGEHGVYYTFQPVPGRQGYRVFAGDQYGRPTFWSLLSQSGVRCTVFDAPYTHPEAGSRAAQVFEWGTWAHHWRPASTPSSLLRRLNRACGRYPLGLEALNVGLGPLDPGDMRRRLLASIRAKANATRWLMEWSAWDLFFVVLGETHPAAHYCWSPPSAGDGDDNDGGDDQAGLRILYEEIDRAIGAILERAGRDVTLYVISGDGIGPNQAGWHLLPEVLRRLGFLAEPLTEPTGSGVESGAEGGPTQGGGRATDPIRRLRDALPRDFRKSLARRLPASIRHRLAQRVDTAAIDWSKTRAFCLPTDLEGYVRINLRDREPLGIVAPGLEYERVCDDLVAELGKLTDPVSGRKAVREVVRVDEVFPGPRRHYLPDLIVVWERDLPLTGLSSPSVGTVLGRSPDARPGTHEPPGFLLRHGDDIPAGGLPEKDGHACDGHVCDLAPELLSRYGVRIPGYMRNRKSQPATPRGELP